MPREVTSIRQVINEVPSVTPDFAGAVLPAVEKIHQASQETKIGNNITQAQLEINGITNQYRIDNESDPMKNIQDYNSNVQGVLKKYGEGIGTLYKGQWTNKANGLTNQLKVGQQAWSVKQNAVNAITNLNEGQSGQYKLANIDGQNFGTGDESDFASMFKYEQSRDELKATTEKYLGEETVKQQMKNFESDYFKSFVAGAIQTNPERGLAILEDERASILDASEIKELRSIAKTRNEEIVLERMNIQDTNESILLGSDEFESMNTYDQLLQIDKQSISGDITNKFATAYKKKIQSESSVGAADEQQAYTDLLLQIGELGSKDVKDKKFLNKLNEVRTSVLDKRASGKLSFNSEKKLNQAIQKTSIAKKESEALTELTSGGNPFVWNQNDAYDEVFKKNLNSGDAMLALRDYFNSSEGKSMKTYEKKALAISISDTYQNKGLNTIATNSFNSVVDAEKANLPKGTEIFINGRRAVIE